MNAFDRLPPHSIEAEMCLLGAMMLDVDREQVGQICQLVDSDSFFQADHSILFDAIKRLYEANCPMGDAMLVREELIRRQLLDEIGGVEYLGAILSSAPNAANGLHYASIVREKALLRNLISASGDTIRDAYAVQESADVVLENAERRMFALGQRRAAGRGHLLEDVMHRVFNRIEKGAQHGIDTGFFELDDKLNGMQNGEMIVIAGRPSMGKTGLAANIIENVVGTSLLPCGVFSMEMSEDQLVQRILCSRASVDSQKARKGQLNAQEMGRLSRAVADLAQVPVRIDDSAGLSPQDLRARARQWKREIDIKVLMLDYLQLMDCPGESNRVQAVSKITRDCKAVARELDIPFIVLSQLNRSSEGRDGHRPRMSDLRESGSIEQDADVILLLHREDYYRMSEPDFVPDNLAEVILAKQRNGPTGTVKLTYMNKFTRFENLSAVADPF